jgi:hypothetical protein
MRCFVRSCRGGVRRRSTKYNTNGLSSGNFVLAVSCSYKSRISLPPLRCQKVNGNGIRPQEGFARTHVHSRPPPSFSHQNVGAGLWTWVRADPFCGRSSVCAAAAAMGSRMRCHLPMCDFTGSAGEADYTRDLGRSEATLCAATVTSQHRCRPPPSGASIGMAFGHGRGRKNDTKRMSHLHSSVLPTFFRNGSERWI